MSVKDDDLDLLAAEYVLGTLEEPERSRFDQRLAEDAAARARVEHWQRHLNTLSEAAPPHVPPASIWQAIEQRLPPERTGGLGRSLPFWKGLSALAASMVLVLSALLGIVLTGPQEEHFVVVTAPDTRPLWVVRTPDQRRFTVHTINSPDMEPMVCQLWLVWDDGAVTSLGVLPEGGDTRLRAPRDLDREPARATVLVTVEPPGGSSAPTGRIVYQGAWLTA